MKRGHRGSNPLCPNRGLVEAMARLSMFNSPFPIYGATNWCQPRLIVPIPVQVDSGGPVNARVMSYDGSRMEIELNGAGTASLGIFVGTRYPDRRDGVYTDGGMNPSVVGVGDRYRVQIHGTESVIEEIDGLLTVPLQLDGMLNMRIDPER